jgi:hypothetical protein
MLTHIRLTIKMPPARKRFQPFGGGYLLMVRTLTMSHRLRLVTLRGPLKRRKASRLLFSFFCEARTMLRMPLRGGQWPVLAQKKKKIGQELSFCFSLWTGLCACTPPLAATESWSSPKEKKKPLRGKVPVITACGYRRLRSNHYWPPIIGTYISCQEILRRPIMNGGLPQNKFLLSFLIGQA